QRTFVVILPDVAAVDDAEGDRQFLRGGGENGIELFRGADQVHVEGANGQTRSQGRVIVETREVSSQQDLDVWALIRDSLIGVDESAALLFREIEGEEGFIDLNPIDLIVIL